MLKVNAKSLTVGNQLFLKDSIFPADLEDFDYNLHLEIGVIKEENVKPSKRQNKKSDSQGFQGQASQRDVDKAE